MADNDDPYAHVSKSKLNLKGDSGIKKKKKKKDKKMVDQLSRMIDNTDTTEKSTKKSGSNMTNAELAFKQMQEKNQTKRILEKATMTHKERVEKFNQHLDSLTEHFDIPKVSWTK